MKQFLTDLNFDLPTALITALLIPLAIFFKNVVLRFLKLWGGFLVEGILFTFSKWIMHSLSATLSMKKYCRIQLGNEKYKFLFVPSSLDIALDIDNVFVRLTLQYHKQDKKNFTHYNFLEIGGDSAYADHFISWQSDHRKLTRKL